MKKTLFTSTIFAIAMISGSLFASEPGYYTMFCFKTGDGNHYCTNYEKGAAFCFAGPFKAFAGSQAGHKNLKDCVEDTDWTSYVLNQSIVDALKIKGSTSVTGAFFYCRDHEERTRGKLRMPEEAMNRCVDTNLKPSK